MNQPAKRPFDFPFVRIVRSGLLMLIPVLMVGSVALILRSLPIAAYQRFIAEFAAGLLYTLFSFIYNATFGMLSVYMVVCLAYSATQQRQQGVHVLGIVSAALAAFLISVGFLTESFQLSSFSAVGMFTAIICGTAAPAFYMFLSARLKPAKVFFDGSEPLYNRAIEAIAPLAIVCLLFAAGNFLIDTFLGVSNFWELFSNAVNRLFAAVRLNFFGGLLYILLSSVMWFFGIHGSEVLESVTTHLFEPAMAANAASAAVGAAPTQIYTKTFFDVFVLMGGCGAALALLIALLLFSRRKSSRSLAKMAAGPMLFNINELMVFGLPIVYNPVMFIPFILAPLACFLISAAAMSLGLVPLTTVSVEWTTPILLGGYQSTGSYAGSALQLCNLIVATLIYMPFVKRNDRAKEAENRANIDLLIRLQKENEAQNKTVLLTDEGGIVGSIAKQLVNDLRVAIVNDGLHMLYQPQSDADGLCVGAEALLRWEHPAFGPIYPPLVIKLAAEGGYLTALEKHIFTRVKADMERLGLGRRISINVTAPTLQDDAFIAFLLDTFPEARAGNAPVCIEITEQTELVTNSAVSEMLARLRGHGFRLAIDDFSMGFTSLKYLQESSFDEVKLDGSLVQSVLDSPNTRNIISSIVYLSESLGFSVLAEFVETAAQQKQLEAIGCRVYQGYLFSRPLPPDALFDYCAAAQNATVGRQ